MESVKNVIGALVFVVIALALYPVIQAFTTTAVGNATDSTATLIGLIPMFYVIGIVIGIISFLVLKALKR